MAFTLEAAFVGSLGITELQTLDFALALIYFLLIVLFVDVDPCSHRTDAQHRSSDGRRGF